jgi:heme-degrading monooxygenase HmoA
VVIVVFRSRFKAGADLDAYRVLSAEMREIVATQPGFVSIDSYESDDGSRVSLECFETEDDVRAWRMHPAHRVAQRRGRDEFYAWYSVHVTEVVRSHELQLTASVVTE